MVKRKKAKKKVRKVGHVVISFEEIVNPIDSIFDFIITIDTTPSMQFVQMKARQEAATLVKNLKATFSKCRIGIIFNGDLSDDPQHGGVSYSVTVLQPTDDLKTILEFINKTPSTHLARGDAAYQEVLWQLNNQVRWRPGAERVVVMIGDTSPNEIDDELNTIERDAYDELDEAARKNIRIHAIQCPTGTQDVRFWKSLASTTGGLYFKLAQFHEVFDNITAVCINEAGATTLELFEEFLRSKGRYTRYMDVVFSTITGRRPTVRKSALTPVDPARFQMFEVTEDDCTYTDNQNVNKVQISEFVRDSLGYSYRPKDGRGYYELNRKAKIQDYKKIIVVDRVTGDMFTGEENLRALLNIPVGTSDVKLSQVENLDKYQVFVQSTSVNRALSEGSAFIYDIRGLS